MSAISSCNLASNSAISSLSLFNNWFEENRAELLTELAQKGYVTTNMKVFIKELNSELTSNTDALPTGLGKDQDGAVTHDFTVFLSAIKTKSGK